MNLYETMEFIHAADWKGCRPGLERMEILMESLGNPQKDLKFIHVAGTNGKGSVCAMLNSVLMCAGYRTGLYTSPHLERVHERFQINGEEISDEELIALAEEVKPAVDRMEDTPTEFELITAMALLYFKEKNCDIVVLEVGLGGRLDATNIIPCPEVAVLMNIGLEHTEILGDTLEKIAAEKAGIVKDGGTAVAYDGPPEALTVFEKICGERNAVLCVAAADKLRALSSDLAGQRFSWGEYHELRLSLLGAHQLKNAAAALETVAQLQKKGWGISEKNIRDGLSSVSWHARIEVLCRNPLFLLDGAHNPQCVDMLAKSLKQIVPGRKCVFLTGVLADKDYRKMLRMTFPFADHYLCVTPDNDRALPAYELAAYLKQEGQIAVAHEDVSKALEAALRCPGDSVVVAFGSLYLAGSIQKEFRKYTRTSQRKAGIRAREEIAPPVREELLRRIQERIASGKAFQEASCILSYRAVKGEVNLDELNALAVQMGKKVAFPLCTSDSEMEALVPKGEDSWIAGHYGIPEPVPERSERLQPEEIDLVLCPCTAFDEKCHRMGMGAGYYDRYLSRCTNARITAVAFEAQKMPELDQAPWDQPMEEIYTENAVYVRRKSGSRVGTVE